MGAVCRKQQFDKKKAKSNSNNVNLKKYYKKKKKKEWSCKNAHCRAPDKQGQPHCSVPLETGTTWTCLWLETCSLHDAYSIRNNPFSPQERPLPLPPAMMWGGKEQHLGPSHAPSQLLQKINPVLDKSRTGIQRIQGLPQPNSKREHGNLWRGLSYFRSDGHQSTASPDALTANAGWNVKREIPLHTSCYSYLTE